MEVYIVTCKGVRRAFATWVAALRSVEQTLGKANLTRHAEQAGFWVFLKGKLKKATIERYLVHTEAHIIEGV